MVKGVSVMAALLVLACPALANGTIAPVDAQKAGAASTSGGADVVWFRVPSPSMLPTLKVGSKIIVDLHAYARRQPRVGDIVVFHPPRGADSAMPVCGNPSEGAGTSKPCGVAIPHTSKETLVERVVGLPGDRISIVSGHVIQNGLRERDSYILPCGTDPSCNFRRPVVIPAGEYLTMGDNRGVSDDGRFWGPVPKSSILGKVVRVPAR